MGSTIDPLDKVSLSPEGILYKGLCETEDQLDNIKEHFKSSIPNWFIIIIKSKVNQMSMLTNYVTKSLRNLLT